MFYLSIFTIVKQVMFVTLMDFRRDDEQKIFDLWDQELQIDWQNIFSLMSFGHIKIENDYLTNEVLMYTLSGTNEPTLRTYNLLQEILFDIPFISGRY